MRIDGWASRRAIKRGLAPLGHGVRPRGCTILTYHRVGGGTPDERDVALSDFEAQVDLLADRPVVSLDDALDRLEAGDDRPSVVLTFDDGFADVHERAWPLLRERGLPFTLYVSTAFVGGELVWEGSTARVPSGPALRWEQLGEMVSSGLCTVGNHTHDHVTPEELSADQLDRCDRELRDNLGVEAHHFAYTWGVPVPRMEAELRRRYRSAVTGLVGRNRPGDDPLRLRRLPVRRTDPPAFFALKTDGGLGPERLYDGLTRTVKRVGVRG